MRCHHRRRLPPRAAAVHVVASYNIVSYDMLMGGRARRARRLEEQLDVLEGFQAAFLAARPAGHRCGGGAARAAAARDDLPAMISYLASARFGPALLSTYARQARRPPSRAPCGRRRVAAARHGVSLDAAGRVQGTLRPRPRCRPRALLSMHPRQDRTHLAQHVNWGSGPKRRVLQRPAAHGFACAQRRAGGGRACMCKLSWSWCAEGVRYLTSAEACSIGDHAAWAVWREQAQEFDDDEDEEGDDGEYEGDDSEDEGDDGEEVQLMYEEEADDAGPIEGAWGGEFVEDSDVGEVRSALIGLV